MSHAWVFWWTRYIEFVYERSFLNILICNLYMQQFSNWVEKIQTILFNDINMYFHVHSCIRTNVQTFRAFKNSRTTNASKIPGHVRKNVRKIFENCYIWSKTWWYNVINKKVLIQGTIFGSFKNNVYLYIVCIYMRIIYSLFLIQMFTPWTRAIDFTSWNIQKYWVLCIRITKRDFHSIHSWSSRLVD